LNPDLPYRKPACYQLIFVALYWAGLKKSMFI
jgi:hypothetical protein